MPANALTKIEGQASVCADVCDCQIRGKWKQRGWLIRGTERTCVTSSRHTEQEKKTAAVKKSLFDSDGDEF